MGNQKIKKLDEYAKQALQGLPQWSYPDFKIEKSEKNIFMGSGDAANTGKIFAKFLGGHALNVCNYQPFFEDLLIENPNIYIICASGGKDGTNGSMADAKRMAAEADYIQSGAAYGKILKAGRYLCFSFYR